MNLTLDQLIVQAQYEAELYSEVRPCFETYYAQGVLEALLRLKQLEESAQKEERP